MNLLRPRLTAADIVAHAVPRHLREEYRRFGYVTDLTVSALTERAARQWPDRPALVQADRRLTYRELRELVERAAGWLAGAGAGPGDVVCWQTPNWWEAHVLGLAIWHLDAVSCPVVPFYREHELRQIIDDGSFADLINRQSAQASSALLAGITADDIALLFLSDPTKTADVVKTLEANKDSLGIQKILSGQSLQLLFGNAVFQMSRQSGQTPQDFPWRCIPLVGASDLSLLVFLEFRNPAGPVKIQIRVEVLFVESIDAVGMV